MLTKLCTFRFEILAEKSNSIFFDGEETNRDRLLLGSTIFFSSGSIARILTGTERLLSKKREFAGARGYRRPRLDDRLIARLRFAKESLESRVNRTMKPYPREKRQPFRNSVLDGSRSIRGFKKKCKIR